MCVYAVVSRLRLWFTGVRHINLRSVNYNNPHRICQKAAGEGYCLIVLFNMFNHGNQCSFIIELRVFYNDIKQGFQSFTDFVSLKAIFNKVIS